MSNNRIAVIIKNHRIEDVRRNILMTTFVSPTLPGGNLAFENSELDILKKDPRKAIFLKTLQAFDTTTGHYDQPILEVVRDDADNILSIETNDEIPDVVLDTANITAEMTQSSTSYAEFSKYAFLYNEHPVIREYLDTHSQHEFRDIHSMSVVYGEYMKVISKYLHEHQIVSGRSYEDGAIELVYQFPKTTGQEDIVIRSLAAISATVHTLMS